jgi:hypothetical protein
VIETGTDSNRYLTQGFNQPQQKIRFIQLRAFIEGFYKGTRMQSPLYNNNQTLDSLLCDSITVELVSGSPSYSHLWRGSVVIRTDGNTECEVPLLTESFYIVLKHRNSLCVWSKNSFRLSEQIVVCDFTTSNTSAYGNNLKQLAPGVYALHSGDLNQDDRIDENDVQLLEQALSTFETGYHVSDLNGDVMCESADFSLLENNFGLVLMRP